MRRGAAVQDCEKIQKNNLGSLPPAILHMASRCFHTAAETSGGYVQLSRRVACASAAPSAVPLFLMGLELS